MSLSLQSLMHDDVTEASGPSAIAELMAFLLVGGVAALCFVGLSAMMIGLGTGLPDWVVSAGCYAAMLVPAYLGHRRYSFRSAVAHRVAFPRYAAVQLVAIVLAALFSYVCYSLFGMATLVAALFVAVLTAGVNFIVLKLWAFAARR